MKILTTLCFLFILVACAPSTNGQGLAVHDIVLLGDNGVVYTYAYGAAHSFRIGQTVYNTSETTAETLNPENFLQIRNALQINGEPYLRRSMPRVAAPIEVRRSVLSSDVLVRTNNPVEAVLYFDGQRWFELLEQSPNRFDNQVVPQERLNALRGVGELTTTEANAVAKYLEWFKEPVAVAVLSQNSVKIPKPDKIDDYKLTVLYVQRDLPEEMSNFVEVPQNLSWEVIAEGDQAVGKDGLSFDIATSANGLLRSWNQAYGSRLNLPTVPVVSFARDSVITVYAGQQSTGGYGLKVDDVLIQDGEVYIDVTVLEPSAGAFVTQAFTSPWVMLSVSRPNLELAWIRDSSTGNLLGVARQ